MSSANSTPRSFQPRSSPLPIVEADYDQDSVRSFNQSAINKHILSSTNYQILNVIPSLPQQEAVRVLQHLDNHLVTQSLAVIRSFQPAQFQPGSLTEKEFRAYLQLRDCADDLVTKWLNSYRSSGTFNDLACSNTTLHAGTQQATSWSVPEAPLRSSSIFTAGSSAISAWPSSPSTGLTKQSTPRTSLGSASFYPEPLSDNFFDGRTISSSATIKHSHGCPFSDCKKPRHIGTCDGWKRHMKEHETVWPCSLCIDVDTSGKAKSYSRKRNLVEHLEKIHNFPNNAASDLADTWKKTSPKIYLSCGFCISLFNSIQDQLNHIDNEHFKNMQMIGEWDINKVVRGLLTRRDVSLVWQNFLQETCPASQEPIWDPVVAEELQSQLERSSEKATDLAKLAIASVKWRGSLHKSSHSIHTSTSPYEWGQSRSSFLEHQNSLIPPALPDGMSLGWSTDNATSLPWSTQGYPMAWNAADMPESESESLQVPLTTLNSEGNSYGNIPARYQYSASGSTSDSSTAEGSRGLLRQALDPAAWPGTVVNGSGNRNRHAQYQVSMPTAPFHVPRNLTLGSSPSLSPYQHSPAVTNVYRAEHTDSFPSAINSPAVSLAQVQGRFSDPELVPSARRLNKQRSRKKLREYYGAPDEDIDELQKLMRDDDRTRSVRRQK